MGEDARREIDCLSIWHPFLVSNILVGVTFHDGYAKACCASLDLHGFDTAPGIIASAALYSVNPRGFAVILWTLEHGD